jgi:hypothetical protein
VGGCPNQLITLCQFMVARERLRDALGIATA